MKKRKNELDVDFIGEGRSLTKEEEKAISEFIEASKGWNKKQDLQKAGMSLRKKKVTS